jgi:hypothetical protein
MDNPWHNKVVVFAARQQAKVPASAIKKSLFTPLRQE